MVNQISISQEEGVQDLLDNTIINRDNQGAIPNFRLPSNPWDSKHIKWLVRNPKKP